MTFTTKLNRSIVAVTLAAAALSLIGTPVLGQPVSANDAPVSLNPPAAPVALAVPKLALRLTADDRTVSAPATITYTIVVTNDGAAKAADVGLEVTLPDEFRPTDPAAAKTLTSLGDLAAQASIKKHLLATVPKGTMAGRYDLTVSAAATGAEPVQQTLSVTVEKGKVLGAFTTLPNTGAGLVDLLVFTIAAALSIGGLGILRRRT